MRSLQDTSKTVRKHYEVTTHGQQLPQESKHGLIASGVSLIEESQLGPYLARG